MGRMGGAGPGLLLPTSSFTRADRRRLKRALSVAREVRLYRRLEALLFLAEGHSISETARRVRVQRTPVQRWRTRSLSDRDLQALADRPRRGRFRPGGWPPPFNGIPVPVALGRRAGPCPGSPAICARTATSLSARAPYDGGCMRAASAGSARAMSIADGRRIWGRKKGATPPAASPSQATRYRALYRLDALEALSTPAGGLGARG